jgi:AraC-like DNA-binding protein
MPPNTTPARPLAGPLDYPVAYPLGDLVHSAVHHEQSWFDLRTDNHLPLSQTGVTVSRWTGVATDVEDQSHEIDPDRHVVSIALRPMDITAFAAGRLIHQGHMQSGTMRLWEPGLPLRGIFRGGYDALHLCVPNATLAECVQAGCGSPAPLLGSQPFGDPVIEQLAHALIRVDDYGGPFGECYAESLGLAIVARLLGRNAATAPAASPGRISGLPKWRLKRATDYIAAHLGEPIGLADIAASTGLTRMHFAAQFKAATGMRPHEYLLRRRIERAKELLAGSHTPLAEIALEVGFKAQAHFTTVFARIVGETPNAWRREHNGVTTA